MTHNKMEDFTVKADRMIHKMQTINELLKRSSKLSSPDYKLSLTDLKSLAELGETVSLFMELMPGDPSRKETIDHMVSGLKQFEDLDLEKIMQLVSLFSAMQEEES